MLYILACGLGGCWNGYTHAKFCNAKSENDAEKKAEEFSIAEEITEIDNKGYYRSASSFEVFEFNDNINKSVGGRLKESALNMLKYYDENIF